MSLHTTCSQIFRIMWLSSKMILICLINRSCRDKSIWFLHLNLTLKYTLKKTVAQVHLKCSKIGCYRASVPKMALLENWGSQTQVNSALSKLLPSLKANQLQARQDSQRPNKPQTDSICPFNFKICRPPRVLWALLWGRNKAILLCCSKRKYPCSNRKSSEYSSRLRGIRSLGWTFMKFCAKKMLHSSNK